MALLAHRLPLQEGGEPQQRQQLLGCKVAYSKEVPARQP
jgi:hypothetical protein